MKNNQNIDKDIIKLQNVFDFTFDSEFLYVRKSVFNFYRKMTC